MTSTAPVDACGRLRRRRPTASVQARRAAPARGIEAPWGPGDPGTQTVYALGNLKD